MKRVVDGGEEGRSGTQVTMERGGDGGKKARKEGRRTKGEKRERGTLEDVHMFGFKKIGKSDLLQRFPCSSSLRSRLRQLFL